MYNKHSPLIQVPGYTGTLLLGTALDFWFRIPFISGYSSLNFLVKLTKYHQNMNVTFYAKFM